MREYWMASTVNGVDGSNKRDDKSSSLGATFCLSGSSRAEMVKTGLMTNQAFPAFFR